MPRPWRGPKKGTFFMSLDMAGSKHAFQVFWLPLNTWQEHPACQELYHCWFNPLQTCGIYRWCSFYFKNHLFTLYLIARLFLDRRNSNGLIKGPKKAVKKLPLFQRQAVRPGEKCWCAHCVPCCLLSPPFTPRVPAHPAGPSRPLCSS